MVFEAAAKAREPHRITFYLQELAGMFHPYYNTHRVVTDDSSVTAARLALCRAVRLVIREGLSILGITAPDRM
jgi:arginyl-tRNA synthetase